MSNNIVVTGNITLQGNYTGPTRTKVAILQDVQPSGTNGGSSIAGIQDRTLNTKIDPENIITLDSGNVLFSFNETGNYYMEILTQQYKILSSQTYLTYGNNTVIDVGSSDYVGGQLNYMGESVLHSILQVSNTGTTYKVRQYTQNARGTLGFGVASNYGVDEVYTTVTVIKLY